jgi:hypothetical protein
MVIDWKIPGIQGFKSGEVLEDKRSQSEDRILQYLHCHSSFVDASPTVMLYGCYLATNPVKGQSRPRFTRFTLREKSGRVIFHRKANYCMSDWKACTSCPWSSSLPFQFATRENQVYRIWCCAITLGTFFFYKSLGVMWAEEEDNAYSELEYIVSKHKQKPMTCWTFNVSWPTTSIDPFKTIAANS